MDSRKSKAKNLMLGIISGTKDLENEEQSKASSIIPHREERTQEHGKAKKSKTKIITTMWVDPKKCRIQQRPNRLYDLLTEDNCRE